MFDFDIFTRVCTQAYKEVPTPYTLQEVLGVFKYFFDSYREEMGEDHLPIYKAQIARIIHAMPYYDKPPDNPVCADIDPEDYPILIDAYFRTPFRNCDYRIYNFFSGEVRTLRMYEKLY